MSLQKLLTGIRAAIRDEANCESVTEEYKRLNQLLLPRVEQIDSLLAEYNERNPNQITAEVVAGFLADKPLAQRDQGKDLWNLLWSAFRPITPETGLAGAVMEDYCLRFSCLSKLSRSKVSK